MSNKYHGTLPPDEVHELAAARSMMSANAWSVIMALARKTFRNPHLSVGENVTHALARNIGKVSGETIANLEDADFARILNS
jgi:hypothetical protein